MTLLEAGSAPAVVFGHLVAYVMLGFFAVYSVPGLLYLGALVLAVGGLSQAKVASRLFPGLSVAQAHAAALSAGSIGAILAAVLNAVTVTGFPFATWPEGRLLSSAFHEAFPPGPHFGFVGNLLVAIAVVMVAVRVIPRAAAVLSDRRRATVLCGMALVATILMLGETLLRFVD
jgi:hypothetical protein